MLFVLLAAPVVYAQNVNPASLHMSANRGGSAVLPLSQVASNSIEDGRGKKGAGIDTRADIQHALLGDFNGDGRTDMMFASGPGSWTVCLAQTFAFQCSVWRSTSDLSGGNILLGDFNGNGRTDMMVASGPGSWTVCLAQTSAFQCDIWRSTSDLSGEDILLGDFNGSGRTDMMVSLGLGRWNVCFAETFAFVCNVWNSNLNAFVPDVVQERASGGAWKAEAMPLGAVKSVAPSLSFLAAS